MEDRRSPGGYGPLDQLMRLPTAVFLERVPIPTLAVHSDGTIVFANPACEEMLGYPPSQLVDSSADALLPGVPLNGKTAYQTLESSAGKIVVMQHADASTVRAIVSESMLIRADDDVALVCFQDVTEQLWNSQSALGVEI